MQKLSGITFSESVDKCPTCSSGDVESFICLAHKSIVLHYSQCVSCSLIFMSPTMTEVEQENFYTNYYRDIYSGSDTPTDEVISIQKQRGEKAWNIPLPLSKYRTVIGQHKKKGAGLWTEHRSGISRKNQ